MNPVSPIAEAPSYSSSDILLALAVIALVGLALLALFVVGIVAFLRLGTGRAGTVFRVLVWPIGALDLLLALSGYDESFLALAPLGAHGAAYALGLGRRDGQPPPPAPPTT